MRQRAATAATTASALLVATAGATAAGTVQATAPALLTPTAGVAAAATGVVTASSKLAVSATAAMAATCAVTAQSPVTAAAAATTAATASVVAMGAATAQAKAQATASVYVGVTRLGTFTPLAGTIAAQASATPALTVPAGGIPIGATIVVFGYQQTSKPLSISDTRGNTWTYRAGSGAPGIILFDCQVTVALLAGDTITVELRHGWRHLRARCRLVQPVLLRQADQGDVRGDGR